MANFRTIGSMWQLDLSSAEVNEIHGGVGTAAAVAAATCQLWLEPILAAVELVLFSVNAIGGFNGIKLVGVLGTQFVTVTPAFASPIDLVARFADALTNATGLPGGVVGAGIGAGVALLAVGPAGVVLGGVAGWLGTLGGGGPQAGDVHSDRVSVGPWERFLLVTLTPNSVALGSWRGYFCAENGGGGAVHANRHVVGPWETFTLVRNPNGSVSFRTHGGHYLVAESGGGEGSFCNWNRLGIGEWEQFWMEFQPDGLIALKTLSRGTYVSVQ